LAALIALLGKILLPRLTEKSVVVSELVVYPIKSCAGTSVNDATLTRLGLKWDRSFVLSNKAGEMMSQRKLPKMALIKPTIEEEKSCLKLTITYEDKKHVEIFDPQKIRSKKPVTVTVWGQKLQAAKLSEDAAQWFSSILGIECFLATTLGTDIHVRPQKKKYQTKPTDQQGAFSDGFPYLLASQESLDTVNAYLKMDGEKTIQMDRFRPNIVVKNVSKGFAEDYWARIRIGNLKFRVSKPCDRCVMPTVDQKLGKRNKNNQPTRTMRKFRQFQWTKPGKNAIFFGQNLICDAEKGKIRVGDKVTVTCGTSAQGLQNSMMTRLMVGIADILGFT